MKRLDKQFADATKQSDHYKVKQLGSVMHWQLTLQGPKQSPYEGGVFKLDVKFPSEYPFRFPDVKFITPIYHPNVKQDGEICKEMIGEKDWLPNSRFSTVIHTLMSMIAHPNLDHPINLQAGADFKEGLFVQRAKEHTEKYAKAVEK